MLHAVKTLKAGLGTRLGAIGVCNVHSNFYTLIMCNSALVIIFIDALIISCTTFTHSLFLSITVAAEFCVAETVVVEGIEYFWPKTPAGTNAILVCRNNPTFSVTRNCNDFGTWQIFDQAGCGVLTHQLGEILSFSVSCISCL